MTKRCLLAQLVSVRVVAIWAAALLGGVAANGIEPSGLRIHVTAVQGGAQYRPDSQSRWQAATNGLDLPEGVEFRTGPRGTVQFTVGNDQVFRVDRLTVVKVLRADLLPDGTIKTDVGMTYGRVSKDVDQPERPHRDTIVSPAATLAVRGTHVWVHDEPPFYPDTGSLTGQAAYLYWLKAYDVLFGKTGEGKVQVGGDTDNAADYLLDSLPVDPQGIFDGLTPGEITQLLNDDNLYGTTLGIFERTSGFVGGQDLTQSLSTTPSKLPGELQFQLVWTTSGEGSLQSVVDFTVTSPLNEVVSNGMPGPVASGGFYTSGSSVVSDVNGNGHETVQWSPSYATPHATFPTGTYVVTENLLGGVDGFGENPPTVTPTLNVYRYTPSGQFSVNSVPGTELSVDNQNAVYSVSVPSLAVTPVGMGPTNPEFVRASKRK